MNQLCKPCSSLNLVRKAFEDRISFTYSDERVAERPIIEATLGVLHRSQNCPLCRLILYTIAKEEGGDLPSDEEVPWELIWSDRYPDYVVIYYSSSSGLF